MKIITTSLCAFLVLSLSFQLTAMESETLPIKTIPTEIIQQITLFLIHAPSPEQAVVQIKNFLNNPSLIHLWQDPLFIGLVVYQLERNFRDKIIDKETNEKKEFNLIDAAIVFDEPHVMWWIITKITENEDLYNKAKQKIANALGQLIFTKEGPNSLPRLLQNFLEIIFDLGVITPNDFDNHAFGTPLHVAALEGNIPLVQFLLQMGADPNRAGEEIRGSPLTGIIENAKRFSDHPHIIATIVKLLLDAGANWDVYCEEISHEPRPTYLPLAVIRDSPNSIEILQLLLEHGLNPYLPRIRYQGRNISLIDFCDVAIEHLRQTKESESAIIFYEQINRMLKSYVPKT